MRINAMMGATHLDRLLKRDAGVTLIALTALCAVAWAYLLGGAGMSSPAWPQLLNGHEPAAASDMAAMHVATAGAHAHEPTLAGTRDLVLTVTMWWSMMIAMMAPSAVPMVLLYARVARTARSLQGEPVLAHTGWFVAGYLAVWLMFSLGATLLQHGLVRLTWLSPMEMRVQNPWFDAGLLILAGAYQLSPAYEVCLRGCRSPARFLAENYRPGVVGALRLGELHGASCVGCSWLLMLLLFVGGVMNLAWIVGLTLLVAAQKLLPGGLWIGRIAGVALIVWGLASLA